VDPVPNQLLLRRAGSATIEPGTSGSVARNSRHWTTEAVKIELYKIIILSVVLYGYEAEGSLEQGAEEDIWTRER
jgi:hypothetical protein